jgi:hypothetical protein
MNAILIHRESKLLADIATYSSTANRALHECHDDPAPPPVFTIEEICIRAETMTSLLEEILNYRPASHRGINE